MVSASRTIWRITKPQTDHPAGFRGRCPRNPEYGSSAPPWCATPFDFAQGDRSRSLLFDFGALISPHAPRKPGLWLHRVEAILTLALVLIAAGGYLLWARQADLRARRRRALLEEQLPTMTSPWPLLSDEVWRQWVKDGADPQGRGHPLERLTPLEVPEAVRARAPVGPIDGATPPASPDAETQLHAVTADGHLLGPGDWPVCCGRPSTLISRAGAEVSLEALERKFGPLDAAALTDDKSWRALLAAWRQTPTLSRRDDVAFFQCRGCGRAYVGWFEP